MEKLKYWIISGLLLSPFLASAQIIPPPIAGLPGSQNSTISQNIRTTILDALAIVGLLAVAYLIYGGFRYITSAGNEENAEQAKKIIQNSIIGLVVVILSYVIVAVVYNAIWSRV